MMGSGGYPLSALFVLIAGVAVPMAMLAPVVRRGANGVEEYSWAIAGLLSITLLGVLIGLLHHRRAVGCAVGLLTGLVVGLLTAPLMLLPPTEIKMLFVVASLGAIVVAIVAIVARVAQRQSPWPEAKDSIESTKATMDQSGEQSDEPH